MGPVQTYIIFSDGDIWISKYLKKGFGHIMILACDGINWILFNPSKTHFEWEILPVEAIESPFKYHVSGSTVVKVNVQTPKKWWIGKFGLMSCVLMARYYLGIHKIIFTPYQLYRYLIRTGLGEIYGR